ncbi:hypothetical protein MFIFM68171_07160 [Madurella fahalii]|uniref:Uncharacterized protein n=1 Tax=Madurella fahalii TaxID=1157608 RepID=A0ABQ0GHC3_9PEZI
MTFKTGNDAPFGAADNNEQVQIFVLLAHTLQGAGLDKLETALCLMKYVETLTPVALDTLKFHLPYIENLQPDFDPTLNGMTRLGHNRRMPLDIISLVICKAKLRLVEQPRWAHGEQGWVRSMLHRLASAKLRGSVAHDEQWLSNPDCAIWLGIMARLRVMAPRAWNSCLSGATRNAYRVGWLGVFDVKGVELEGTIAAKPVAAPAPTPSPGEDNSIEEAWVAGPAPTTDSTAPALRSMILSQGFFANQTRDRAYLSLIKQLPTLTGKVSRQMRAVPGMQNVRFNNTSQPRRARPLRQQKNTAI